MFAYCSSTISQTNYANAKTNYANKTMYNDTGSQGYSYLVGSTQFPQYQIKVCSYSDTNVQSIKIYSNGKSAPILQSYVAKKSEYIGGVMENEKGNKTTINDITLTSSGSTLLFKVSGKDFSMSFTLETGAILKEDEDTTVFNTDKVGIWKIHMKK